MLIKTHLRSPLSKSRLMNLATKIAGNIDFDDFIRSSTTRAQKSIISVDYLYPTAQSIMFFEGKDVRILL